MFFSKKLTYFSGIVVFALAIIFIVLNSFDFEMLNLPKGELIQSKDSPNKKYTLNAYYVKNEKENKVGVRVELIDNKNGKGKNIYWAYPENNVEIIWVDENHADINDVLLDVTRDTYKRKGSY